MNWTREHIGNYAPLITMVSRRYYHVLRGYSANGEWVVEVSDDRENWTEISAHRTQREAKAWVEQEVR